MLDIRFIRENAELVQKSTEQKGYKVSVAELLKSDEQRRGLQTRVDELRTRRNVIAESMKGGRPSDDLIEESKTIKSELASIESEFKSVDETYAELMQRIPNVIDSDVPIGGEEDSVEIKKVGDQNTGAIDHLDFALKRDWVDFERGAKVAGAKFYYLKGDLALLEQAIIQYAINFAVKNGFTFMTVPNMVNERIAQGAGFAPKGDASGNEYFVEDTNLTMIGTAEAPLTGYHADEIIEEDKLPLMYAGLSPCYRKEAGTYGKHARGLFRVHQFNKLEMYAFVLPEKSWEMHEQMLAIEEAIWKSLEIPYHIINIASGDLGAPAAKKYDLEYWSPVDQKYRELTSCSNCTDFQARNLNIRVRRKDGSIETVHTLNGTAVSLARSLVAVIEHYQNQDGTLRVPEVLKPYLANRDVL